MVRVGCYFVKLWDLSGYSEKSNIQDAYLPKTIISGQIVSEILGNLRTTTTTWSTTTGSDLQGTAQA